MQTSNHISISEINKVIINTQKKKKKKIKKKHSESLMRRKIGYRINDACASYAYDILARLKTLTFLHVHLQAILHGQSQREIICNILSRNQLESVTSQQHDNANKCFKCSQVLSYKIKEKSLVY
jgi:hypothetical protein